jgi:O-antigen ligase
MEKQGRIGQLSLAGFFALLPGACVGGGLALPTLAALAGLAGLRPSKLLESAKRNPTPLIFLGTFVLWAIASTLWSPWPDHRQALRLAATVGGGLLFCAAAGADEKARRVTEAGGLAALWVLMALLCVELFFNLPLNRAMQTHESRLWVLERNPGRGVTMLVVLGWGVLAALLARGGPLRLALALISSVLIGAFSGQFSMDANMAAYAAGLLAFGFGFALPRLAILATSGAVSAWLIAAPFATPLLVSDRRLVDELPQSWAIRTEIWKFASARIHEAPWIGRGLDASRSFGADRINVRGLITHAIPLHPHSASLQIWLETGAVGALLGVAALMSGAIALSRGFALNRPAAAAVCATIASFAVISNVSFGAWQEWWQATAFLGAALIAAISVRPHA